ncbi:hypothetical protein VTL71DRAFT_12662 [Oculimacula yallundae]|uniref:Uncharacterized protein n=1 Tax=Oculimacula yallundae TaxID=86028 RepID=A0ABR4CNV8_9HELO
MNWTEGRLQRHSTTNSKNSAAQRQKQHFARAQQRLRTGGIVQKSSPMKFSVFGIDIRDRDRLDQKVSPMQYSSSMNGDNPTQGSRADFATTPHLPPPNTRVKASNRSHEHKSRRPHQPPIKRDPSQVPEDDLYSATPLPRPVKRKRDDLLSESDMVIAPRREDEESLSDIKKRLLRRGDWVGVTLQKPLQLAFNSVKNDNDIGRRRTVTNGQKAKYTSAPTHIVSPFAAKTRPLERYDNVRQPFRAHPSIPDVRISIGGRTVPPGVSSSIGQHRGPSASEKRSPRVVSSEVLLLDRESSRDLYNNNNSRAASERSNETSLLLDSYSESAHQHLDTASQHSHSQQAFPGYYNSRQDNFGVDHHERARMTAYSLPKLPRNSQRLSISDYNVSGRPRRKIVTAVDLRQSLRTGEEIFSSSSASLHCPKPQTSRRSVLLREGSSQLAESNIAQFGNQEPVISSSQILQNSIWRTWVAPRSEEQEDDDRLLDTLELGFTSAGVSTSPPARLPSTSVPEEDTYSTELEEPLLFDQMQEDNDDVSALSNDDDVYDQPDEQGYNGYEEETAEATNVETSSLVNGMSVEHMPSDYEESIVEKIHDASRSPRIDSPIRDQRLDLPPLEPHVSLQPAEDPDEVWRKFVFGSSDKPQSSYPSAAEQVDSIVAHPSSRQDLEGNFQSVSPPRPAKIKASDPFPLPATHLSYAMAEPGLRRSSPSRDGRTSLQASNGSALSSSSELASNAMAVHAKSPLSTSYTDLSGSSRPQRRIIFSKPKPFIGRKSKTGIQSAEEPLYIGRPLRGNQEEDLRGLERKRGMGPNFADTDEQDELESIEDD